MPRDRTKFTKQRPLASDSVEAEWRLFVAIDFPESHRESLSDLLTIARDRNPAIRWIATNAAHLTLQFIGEVPVETAELLRLAVPTVSGSRLRLHVDGAAFPNLQKPQVVWLGLAGDIGRLRSLQFAVEDFLAGFEIPAEEREFKPHITLGRARSKLQSPEINTLIATMRSPEVKRLLADLENPFTVDRVVLYRSHLTKEGSRYEQIAVARLDEGQ